MPDIHELFDPIRGDLLYGFAADRTEFYNHIQACPANCAVRQFFDAGCDESWITVDYYNDTLFGDSTLFDGNDTNPLAVRTASITEDWVSYFWQHMGAHRFSPLDAYNAPQEKRNKEGWNDLANDRYYLAIRRGCKFGIEHILNAASPDAKIHFLLDRFERNLGERMVQAVYKETSDARGRTAVSITYSEIRYVYRNWNRLNGRVLFYYNFQEAPAPWEDTVRNAIWVDSGVPHVETYKDLWAMYGSERKDKLLAMINRGKVSLAVNYAGNRINVDRLVQEANGLDPDGQCAKYEQALLLLQPDRKRWRELRA